MITIAAVDDDRMLISGLTAWVDSAPDLRLVATVESVDQLMQRDMGTIDVVVLDLMLADNSDPATNVRRIIRAGPKVLVATVMADPAHMLATHAAGAAGYLTKNHDLAELAAMIRDIHRGQQMFPSELAFAIAHDSRPNKPRLSDQELRLLVAYASGMTLDSAARRTSIRPATAKHYLERVKEKYRSVGRPTYTKLDLANRVREDGLVAGDPPPP
ncbi:LuxR family two component transcriptional regulator [Micromonospora sp. Llam0]|nr:LuxR family two component transcriptional regulator [Micromonospora sp. Llam0]